MKKLIVMTLYNFGDMLSRTFKFMPLLYKPYCKIMNLSYRLQMKWDLDEPWSTDF